MLSAIQQLKLLLPQIQKIEEESLENLLEEMLDKELRIYYMDDKMP